ncbi:MAG: TPM domain-containing protein [Lachnospiraceae bacterium]|nr:TPM domain-containing protein [Lachnospiraceae bacterium]
MKWKRTILLLLFGILLTGLGDVFLTGSGANDADAVFASGSWVDDGAWLFEESEIRQLEEDCASYGDEIGADLVIVTVDQDTNEAGTDYARSYLLENGFGKGSGREGIIFLIDMYQREYTVYEYNKEASGYLLTDYEGDCILDALESPMRSGRYYDAAREFLDCCVYYAGVDLGDNYDSPSSLHAEPAGVNWLICVVIGLAGGALITGILIATRNGDQKPSSGVYMKDGRLEIRHRDDVFINTTVVKRKIETESRSGKGGGGGFSGGKSGGGHGGSRGF